MKRFSASLALLVLTFAVPYAIGQASNPGPASYLQTIKRAPTVTTLNSSASVVGPTDPLTLTAVVSYPTTGQVTGNVTFTVENGNTLVGNYAAAVDQGGVATLPTTLPTGTLTISAAFAGDANLLASASQPITQVVLGPADFDFSMEPISVVQGQTGAASAPVTAINGFHGPITFTCASPIATLNCGMLPAVVTVPTPVGLVTASAPGGQASFNVTTIATTVTHASLIGVFVLSLASINRKRKYLLMLAVAMLALTVGCGTGTRYLQTDGTPKGTYAITVTGASGALSHTKTVLVTVR